MKRWWFDYVKSEMLISDEKDFKNYMFTEFLPNAIDCFEMSTIKLMFENVCIHNDTNGNIYISDRRFQYTVYPRFCPPRYCLNSFLSKFLCAPACPMGSVMLTDPGLV